MKAMPGSKNNEPKSNRYQDGGLPGAKQGGVKSQSSDFGKTAGLNSGKVSK